MRWFPLLVVAGIFGIKKRRPEIASAGRESSRTAKTVRRRCLLQALITRLSARIAIDPGKNIPASGMPVSGRRSSPLKSQGDEHLQRLRLNFRLAIGMCIFCAIAVSNANCCQPFVQSSRRSDLAGSRNKGQGALD
ncbi:hypothetical protein CWR43_11430 [Rhizobium sullae]|uniref:Uncharacterized protein n=1 Tax=Rhizobium sullae TaxID=50338 RepID=A0A2N0DBT4_RHISU|nr:hypothetical protein CWR43_11430 [Rhizobium sullae]